jgi:integrase
MRRAKGEGSIFYDETSNRWVGRLDLGRDPRTGKRRRRKVTAATKTEAARRLAELRDQRHAGAIAMERPSVEDLTTRWLERVAVRKTDSTRAMYEHLAAKHLTTIGSIRVDQLTVRQVEDWLDARSHLAQSTLRKLRSLLAQILDYARRYGIVTVNVARDAELPPTTKPARQPRSLDREEAAALLTAAGGHRLEAWFHVMLGTGARPGEIGALTWDDVDLDEATARIVATKTRDRVRVLRIGASVVDALRNHRKVQNEERLLMGSRWPEKYDPLVFRSEAGTPLDAANARRLVRTIATEAHIAHLTPYELRHTHASILSDAGVHAEALADRMGHRDSRTTLSYYRHQITPVVEVGADLDFRAGSG